ncbi:hypothetical protein OAB90_00130 [bacterium]|jgi:hypothetical protein|nr:hypothetical protein [bacterium]
MKYISNKSLILPFLNLFTSFGTIICCALPALFVSIGTGAALAGLISNVPQLVTLSKYKGEVFFIAGLFLLFTGIYQWKIRGAPCPTEPELARTCQRIRKINKYVYLLSLIFYLIGFFFAFLASKFFAT